MKKITRLAAVTVLFGLAALVLTSTGSQASPAHVVPPTATSVQSNKTTTLVLHVYYKDNAERDRLANELGAEEVATTGGYLTVLADWSTYASILGRGLHVEIDQQATTDLNSRVPPAPGSPNTFFGGYRTVEEMQTFLDQQVATYPTLAQKVDIGDSWCKVHPGSCTQPAPYNGYDLSVMHITNQAIPGPKPVFWFETGIHSREIATPEMATRFISWLLDNYNTNADAHWLVDWHDIWVMPMVNPDGHHIVEAGGGGSSPYYQRKNANNTNGCTTWPPGISVQFGTDLNRNFSFLWDCCGGSSAASCDQTYHGSSAASDPETQFVSNKIRQLIPDQRGPNNTDAAPLNATGLYQSMHSNAALNLYPWGWTTTIAPNGADLANISAHMAASNAGGNGYQSCQPPACLYAVDGDTADWGYGELGIPAFTTEVGGTDFLIPYSQVDPMFTLNRGAFIYQAKVSRTPYLLTRGPDANSVATSPLTVTQGTPSSLSGSINYAWTGNTYAQNVAAAEYYIDTPPWDGGVGIPMSGAFSSQTVAVSASVDTTGLTPGRHIIFVRGRGVNNYGGFPSWGPPSAVFLDVLTPPGTPTPTFTGTPPTSTSTRTPTPTFTVTNTPTLTPTPCNNYTVTTSTGSIVAGTTDIGNHCDDCITTVVLPFTYSLYGSPFSSVNVDSNGNLQFGSNTTVFSNTCLPNGALSYVIYAHWDDLLTNSTGAGVFTSISGVAPNRIFNIEWRTTLFTGGGSVNFEVRLYEGQSRFDLVYGTVSSGGMSATVGVQKDNGSQLVQYLCNTTGLSSGLQLSFTLPTCGATSTPTSTRTFTPTATNTRTNTPIPTSTRTNTPTPTPTALLVGHVTWQGLGTQPDARQQLPISLTLKSGATEVNFPATTTDASGYFTVPLGTLPAGTYDWRVKDARSSVEAHFLANTGTLGLAGPQVGKLAGSNLLTFQPSNLLTTQVEFGLMLGGDANGDNVIDSSDFNIMRATFGQVVGDPGYDPRADFNADGTVSASDFNILRGNFGTAGGQPITPRGSGGR